MPGYGRKRDKYKTTLWECCIVLIRKHNHMVVSDSVMLRLTNGFGWEKPDSSPAAFHQMILSSIADDHLSQLIHDGLQNGEFSNCIIFSTQESTLSLLNRRKLPSSTRAILGYPEKKVCSGEAGNLLTSSFFRIMSGLYSTSFFLFHLFPSFSLSLLALSFLFFKLEANYFTILWWFLPYIHMNPPWVYMCSPSWTPLPPPSLSHPSGSSYCHQPWAPCLMHRTWTGCLFHIW